MLQISLFSNFNCCDSDLCLCWQVVNSQLQFRYDLGSNDRIVALAGVNVSDGVMHLARVERHGNQVVLRLDSGEGQFYAERWPVDEHRLLRLSSATGGGFVTHNYWTNAPIIQSQIVQSRLWQCYFVASSVCCGLMAKTAQDFSIEMLQLINQLHFGTGHLCCWDYFAG